MKTLLALIATSGLALGVAGTALAQSTTPSGSSATPGSSSTVQTAPSTGSTAQPSQRPSRHKAASQDHVKTIQTALNNNGEQLTVDGKLGPKTVAALKDFQQKHGLKVTGRADQATMSELHTTTM
jgi:peptidoglycan hydrolase-like protein with peptidoglycan-binding domain